MRRSHDLEVVAKAVIDLAPFEHLQEAFLGYLVTEDEIRMHGREKAAYACLPTAMGQIRKVLNWALVEAFGQMPAALVVVNETQWEDMTPGQRIALVYHELRHVGHKHSKDGDPCYSEEGQPVLELVGHEVEEFVDVAERFGAWHDGLAMFRGALDAPNDAALVTAVEARLG